MHINDLPNECLALVLQILALSRLITLRGVCHRWKDLIGSICATRLSLKLFGSAECFGEYCEDIQTHNLANEADFQLVKQGPDVDNVLIVEVESNPDICPFLADLFPKVTELVFFTKHTEYLATLLELWDFQLESQIGRAHV